VSWINTFFFMNNDKKKPLDELNKDLSRVDTRGVLGGRRVIAEPVRKPGVQGGCITVIPQ
jgi:hypothetical protein